MVWNSKSWELVDGGKGERYTHVHIFHYLMLTLSVIHPFL